MYYPILLAMLTHLSIHVVKIMVKLMSAIPTNLLVCGRLAIAGAVGGFYIATHYKDFTKISNYKIYILRAFVRYGAVLLTYYGYKGLSLQTIVAIGFTNPLFTVIVSSLVLGDYLSFKKWLCLLMGCYGGFLTILSDTIVLERYLLTSAALLSLFFIINYLFKQFKYTALPFAAALIALALLPVYELICSSSAPISSNLSAISALLGANFLNSISIVMTKNIADQDGATKSTMLMSLLVGLLAILASAVDSNTDYFGALSLFQIGQIFLLGIVGLLHTYISHLAIIHSSPSYLSMFHYMGIPFAVVTDYLLFGNPIQWSGVLGSLIIVLSATQCGKCDKNNT